MVFRWLLNWGSRCPRRFPLWVLANPGLHGLLENTQLHLWPVTPWELRCLPPLSPDFWGRTNWSYRWYSIPHGSLSTTPQPLHLTRGEPPARAARWLPFSTPEAAPFQRQTSLFPPRTSGWHGGLVPAPNKLVPPTYAGVAQWAPRGGMALRTQGHNPYEPLHFLSRFEAWGGHGLHSYLELGAKRLGRHNRGMKHQAGHCSPYPSARRP